ncbi:uncharacterized protein LOC135197539 [Macrobrachium nipponense]|uniref:uncharacterized protein LOC135197539 n=1 Tax=Macrobrachium nipponense TaxID=159736 RepID=UPI0030C889EC
MAKMADGDNAGRAHRRRLRSDNRNAQTYQAILERLDSSDISSADDDDDDWVPEAVSSRGNILSSSDDSSSEDEDENATVQVPNVTSSNSQGRRSFYLRDIDFRDTFISDEPEKNGDGRSFRPIDYFRSYMNMDFIEHIALCTNMKATETTGSSLGTSGEENCSVS